MKITANEAAWFRPPFTDKMKYRPPDYFPEEPEWGRGNYKDIIRQQHAFRESLPLPIVTYPDVYGTWLCFQERLDTPPFFCSCQKRPMLNFLRMNESLTVYRLCRGDSLFRHFIPANLTILLPHVSNASEIEKANVFRDNLCHKCLLRVPFVRWSNLGEHSVFVQHFGWYWRQMMLAFGISWYGPFLRQECPQQILDLLQGNPADGHILRDQPPIARKTAERECERMLREHFGFPPRGKTLNNETLLFLIIRSIFSSSSVYRHARPDFLNGLTLDIYIPDHRIALEYQGEQHFDSFEHLGGDRQFRKLLKRDNAKEIACRRNSVLLVYFDRSDRMTEDWVRQKISQQSGGASVLPGAGKTHAHP